MMGSARRRKRRTNEKASVAGATINSSSHVKNKRALDGSTAAENSNHVETRESQQHSSQQAHVLAANICAVMGFLLYVNAIWMCGFCYDDGIAIEKNRDVLNTDGNQVMSPLADIWTHDFWGVDIRSAPSNKSYRPLVILSFRMDAMISREPWMFHLTNALLFAIVCWLVVHVLLSWISANSLNGGKGSGNDEAVTAVLLTGWWFASHPIHTEAVTSLVGRAEVLAAMFCLVGSKLVYNEGFHKNQGAWWRWPIGALLLFAACLCKETAVVLPAVLAAADVAVLLLAPRHTPETTPTTLLKRRAAIVASVSIAYLWLRVWLLIGDSETGQTLALSRIDINFVGHLAGMNKLRTTIYIQATYMKLLAWPSVLSCDYSLGVIEPVTSWFCPKMAFSALVALGVVTWLWCGVVLVRKRGDVTLLLALGWTFGPLIPASHIVGIGTVMAERLLFLPSIGVTMLICRFLLWLTTTFPTGWSNAQIVLSITVVLFAYKTITRNPDWADTGRLVDADLESYPKATKLLLMRARFPLTDQDTAFDYVTTVQEVLDRHTSSLTMSPYPNAKRHMAQLKAETEWHGANLSEAVEYANEVIAMGNRFGIDEWSWIHNKKGRALLNLAAPTNNAALLNEAAESFKVAIDYSRDHQSRGRRLCSLASTLAALKQNQEAHERYEECIQIRRGAVGFADRRNHAIALRNLVGADASAAQIWGPSAVNAIQELLKRPNEVGGEMQFWISSKDSISKLISESSETDDASAKDAILALVKEAAEADGSAN